MSSVSASTAPGWTPARVYLAAAGFYLILIGTLGFLLDRSFPTRSASVAGDAKVFGIFLTNGWHNLAGVVFGVIAVAFFFTRKQERLGALIVGVPNALVMVTFLLWDPATFWFASNAADNVVHALLGFGGIAAGLATPAVPRV